MPLWLLMFYDVVAPVDTVSLIVTFPVHAYFLFIIVPLYAVCSMTESVRSVQQRHQAQ